MKKWSAPKIVTIPAIIVLLFGLVGMIMYARGVGFLTKFFFRPTSSSIPTGVSSSDMLEDTLPNAEMPQVQVVAENISIPWELVFLPDDSMLVTQRTGELLRIYPENRRTIQVDGVAHRGEGGLLGMVLDPDFETNNWLYLYMTTTADGSLSNRVVRYEFDPDTNSLDSPKSILEAIPGAIYHDGGRLAFGPDGKLYISTGDARNPDDAQRLRSLAGKVLRVNPDGSHPSDNPFGDNHVYSYGHRNVQGLSWDSQDRLWVSEHGPSGARSGYDEINLIQPGKNYGWPTQLGDNHQPPDVAPVIHSGIDETWAPGDILVYEDIVLFTGLRGASLYSAVIEGDSLTNMRRHFSGDWGRLRSVIAGPDGGVYILTSNTDGRAQPGPNDDKIIRLSPELVRSWSQ